ncbi:uncharacterized protein LOC115461813 isoform X2 [Microcaecilia unicolor]|uniref:Uncharacterized protein LOC115461813 isoform X2 n=1 Tax=Microcaecilia unicolor TaxID=1415580 RepID=A0A6P7WWZ2_9AMPH|nr:uncharacterized protein LOC115461813 isoform X2 [Microcaecilia unicolor]
MGVRRDPQSQRMDGGQASQPQEKKWSEAETHALLDLIRDLGLVGLLSRKWFQNWDVFERLHVFLKRSNIHFSPGQIKARWKKLKLKYLRLKRFVQMGASPGLLADFPYYQGLEQLLGAAPKTSGLCRREADSSGLSSTAGLEQRTVGVAIAPVLDDAEVVLEELDEVLGEEVGGFSLPPTPEENDGISVGLSEENPAGQENLDQRNLSQSAGAVCDVLRESWPVLLHQLETLIQLTTTTLEHVVQMGKEISRQVESLCSEIVGKEVELEPGLLCSTEAVADPASAVSPADAPQQEIPGGASAARRDPEPTKPQESRKRRSTPSSVCPAPRRSMRQRRPSIRYLHY